MATITCRTPTLCRAPTANPAFVRRASAAAAPPAALGRAAMFPGRVALSRRGGLVVVAASKGFGKPPPPKPEKVYTEEEKRDMAKGSQFDDMEASGLPVYGVFIRIKGPGPGPDGGCQWFPVGPMAVESQRAIEREIWNAEEALLKGAFNMYPALASKSKDPGLEYGYRLRDAPQMSEEEIRAGGNPFDNVITVGAKAGGKSVLEENAFESAIKGLKKMFN